MSLGLVVIKITSLWPSYQNVLEDSHEARPKTPKDLLEFFWPIFTFKMGVFMKITASTVCNWFRLIWYDYGVKKLQIY